MKEFLEDILHSSFVFSASENKVYQNSIYLKDLPCKHIIIHVNRTAMLNCVNKSVAERLFRSIRRQSKLEKAGLRRWQRIRIFIDFHDLETLR